MKKIVFILIILVAYSGFAQQNLPNTISWSGIITDDAGVALQDTNVNLKFTLTKYETEIYSETQLQTTDGNGFITANIGAGDAITGDFQSIVFNKTEIYLKVEANTGAGFVTLQNDRVNAVPLAKAAEAAYMLYLDDNSVSLAGNSIYFTINDELRAKLSDYGLRLTNLEDLTATGNALVEVTPDGILQRSETTSIPQEKYLSISALEFEKEGYTFGESWGLANDTGSTEEFSKIIGLHLPDGAAITQIQISYRDSDNTGLRNLKFSIRKHGDVISGQDVFYFDTGDGSTSNDIQTYIYSPSDLVIDNQNYAYTLRLLSYEWPTIDDGILGFKRILITYIE